MSINTNSHFTLQQQIEQKIIKFMAQKLSSEDIIKLLKAKVAIAKENLERSTKVFEAHHSHTAEMNMILDSKVKDAYEDLLKTIETLSE